MNLRERYNALLAKAEDLTGQISKAIEAEEYEQAEELQVDYDSVIKQAEVVKGQIDREESSKAASRLPFDTTGDQEPADEPEQDSFNKAINVLRYGQVDDAVKAVATDIWGKDYNEKRNEQHRAFTKFIRFGENRLDRKESALLRDLIYTPETISQEVKAGYSVNEIKTNKTDQQESILELGGALVPEDTRMEVIRRLAGATSVRGRARVLNTARDAVEFPKLEGGDSRYTSGVRVTWADAEIPGSSDFAQTNFELGTVKIPVHTVNARTDVSLNLLEDAGMDIVGFITELFAEAQAIDENEQFLTGTGGGRPRGILGNRSGAEKTPEDGIGNVVSGEASALTADGLIDLVYELDAQYQTNAVLVGNKQTFRQIRKLKDGNGDYLWAKGIERGAPPTVLGYDYLMDEAMPSVAANAYPLIHGDLRGYFIVERVGMSVRRIEDVSTYGRNKAAIFMRRRLGGQTVMPYMFKVQKVAAS